MLLTCDANQGQDSAALPRARTWLPGRGEALKLRGSPDSGCTPPLSRKGQSARRKQTGGVVRTATVEGGTQPSHQPLGGAGRRSGARLDRTELRCISDWEMPFGPACRTAPVPDPHFARSHPRCGVALDGASLAGQLRCSWVAWLGVRLRGWVTTFSPRSLGWACSSTSVGLWWKVRRLDGGRSGMLPGSRLSLSSPERVPPV